VVVPLAGSVFAILAWHLHRRDLLTAPHVSVALALCVYVAGIVANTIFPIFLDKPARDARWSEFVYATPLVGYDVADALTNICVFVPLGVLVSLVAPRWSWVHVLGVVTVSSLSIEVVQYLTAHLLGGGHIADVNDLTFNVVGGALGLLVLASLSRVPMAARMIDRFRWS
jgi:glycopeptide antibiotics resistance protein